MLSAFLGTDRTKARAALEKHLPRGSNVLRLSDASSTEDVSSALQSGASLFGEKRAVVLDGVCLNREARDVLFASLSSLAQSNDSFFVLEEKPDAEFTRALKKFAKLVESFDSPKKREESSFFVLANNLKKGDKKNLWVAYQREIAKGIAPEALHGIFFWAAKDMVLKSRRAELEKGKRLVAALAELPHAARRRGEDLEYALERFILSGA